MADLHKSILIGNGINQLVSGNGISWGQLLERIQGSFNAEHIDLRNEYKPFPLSFEEILFATFGSFDENIRTIKNNIAQAFFTAEPNSFHKRVLDNKNIHNIITTNYDYTFEKVIEPNFSNSGDRLKYATTETKHSIKRRCCLDYNSVEKSIWHIHGEINHNQKFSDGHFAAESIQIGYDHYVEYLNEIQSYLKGQKYKEQPKISNKLRNLIDGVSWIDLFFTDYLVIIGLDLDFSEIDLWWLLNYRSKIFKRYNDLDANTIVYYQPILPQNASHSKAEEIRQENKRLKMAAKQDVLTSLGVRFKQVLCDSYEDFYNKVFDIEKI